MTEKVLGLPETSAPPFRVLGPLQVRGSEEPLRVPPGRQEVILAALLLESNRVVSTHYLVDLIWQDDPPETARTQVQICVSRLRKLLADADCEVSITTRPPGYVLNTDAVNVDSALFTEQVTRARRLRDQGAPEQAVERLKAAMRLWQGDCLTGMDSGPLANRARQLNEERLAALELRMRIELELGRHDRLVGELQMLTHEHPLRERLRGQLMQALYWSGRQAEALDVFQAGRVLLDEELGLEPGRELKDLQSAILAGELPPPAGPGPGPTARTQAEPEDSAEGAAAAPPTAERHDEIPHQMPATTADFVADPGRLAELERALTGGPGRHTAGLVAITGKPGTGKSTLAVHMAHMLAETGFPDGQLYCDLRGTTGAPATSAEVLGRFLRALGIPGQLIPESLDERAEMYRTRLASRRVLVVLDDALSEGQVRPLLPGSRDCAVLVTSRARLTALPGAHRVELDVLEEDRALELLSRIIGEDRVRDEAVAAEALVRTVGRLPLALRIVAARLAARPHWTLASMVHRLANERHRLDELTHGEMTMRASLSLTYDGLAAADARLLRLLSMAQAPTLPSWLAGALLDDDRPFPSDLMEPLVDVQMLDVVGVESTGGYRYRFHEIIRVYAREQLAAQETPEDREAALVRMAGGWMHLAEQAHRKVYGGDYTVLHGTAPRWEPPVVGTDQLLADPMAWLDAEQGALCGMVEQAADEGLHDVSWDLATTLVTLFEVRGHYDLWEQTHLKALGAVRKAGNLRGAAAVQASLGSLYMSRNQFDRARQTLGSALDIFETLEEPEGRALCRRDLALIARTSGDDDGALELYGRSLADFDRADDVVGRAIVLTQSAHIRMRRGDRAAAQTQLDEALAIYEGVGYTGGRARTLRRVGQLLLERGDHDQAVLTFTEVLELCHDSGDVIGEGHLLRDLGHAFTLMGRPERARSFYDRAIATREHIMDFSGGALARLDLARLLEGDAAEAAGSRELLLPAVDVFRDRGMARELTEAKRLLGVG
ncbi:BTAD domain-containing putative transcriptional regulator [Streptomyces griseus]|uniref:BTAD domain-containing putative transcriptional regulator n=1 Tax=Streptomyces stephensoniae TaxID=3375367 RepID=A0ABU2VX57_9ACTN|nr:BTAD domain-containing putative transcriptional regulator [Streptomyces griseus]MDT0490188.1 BTAD domain-containing putative transcriptional regulator [Streptomyces griseus]